jgi:hypothetical protein
MHLPPPTIHRCRRILPHVPYRRSAAEPRPLRERSSPVFPEIKLPLSAPRESLTTTHDGSNSGARTTIRKQKSTKRRFKSGRTERATQFEVILSHELMRQVDSRTSSRIKKRVKIHRNHTRSAYSCSGKFLDGSGSTINLHIAHGDVPDIDVAMRVNSDRVWREEESLFFLQAGISPAR